MDDEQDTVYVLKRTLEINGFNVDAFTDSNMALENFKSRTYDLAIFDFKMKNMDGFRLYESVHKIDNDIKVLFLSGDSNHYAEQMRAFPKLHSSQFLHKPVSMKELIKQVNAVLNL